MTSDPKSRGFVKQVKDSRLLKILELAKSRDIVAKEIGQLFSISWSAANFYMHELVERKLLVNIDPRPRKNLYRISADTYLVESVMEELAESVAQPLTTSSRKNRVIPNISIAEDDPCIENQQVKFRHSLLHMFLFHSIYEDYLPGEM